MVSPIAVLHHPPRTSNDGLKRSGRGSRPETRTRDRAGSSQPTPTWPAESTGTVRGRTPVRQQHPTPPSRSSGKHDPRWPLVVPLHADVQPRPPTPVGPPTNRRDGLTDLLQVSNGTRARIPETSSARLGQPTWPLTPTGLGAPTQTLEQHGPPRVRGTRPRLDDPGRLGQLRRHNWPPLLDQVRFIPKTRIRQGAVSLAILSWPRGRPVPRFCSPADANETPSGPNR